MGKMKEIFIQQREKESIHLTSDEDYQYAMYKLQAEMEERMIKEKAKTKNETNANINRDNRSIS